MAIQHTLLPYYQNEETLIGFVVNLEKKANKKFQLTAGSAVFFQRSYFIKVQCVVRIHRTSASVIWTWRYSLLRRHVAENKPVFEKEKVECCEASFLLEKIKSGRGEHKLAKKRDLTWKSRTLLFQSSSWKSKAERSKASFWCLQVWVRKK